MRKLVGVESLSAQPRASRPGAPSPAAVTVGTFDGVHVGHRLLIGRTIERARELGAEAIAVTWDRHPAVTLRPDRVPRFLSSPERKLELLEEMDLDAAAVLSFNEELSHWPPERFVADVLVEGLGAKSVVVGAGWRFGHKAAGNVALLKELGTEQGFDVEEVDLAAERGDVVSSSRVRAVVASGDMEEARLLLGRPFDIDGEVVRGDDRGAGLGFPTANIALDPSLAHPPRGVYAGRARVDSVWYLAATNLGVNPTFGGDPATSPLRVEAYLLDFDGDLYGKTLRIEFHRRLRDELKFDSVDDLIAQMTRDVEATRALASTD